MIEGNENFVFILVAGFFGFLVGALIVAISTKKDKNNNISEEISKLRLDISNIRNDELINLTNIKTEYGNLLIGDEKINKNLENLEIDIENMRKDIKIIAQEFRNFQSSFNKITTCFIYMDKQYADLKRELGNENRLKFKDEDQDF